MKSETDKQKALTLYVNNLSMEKIAKEVGVQRKTIREWEKKYKWAKIREEAIQEVTKKQPEKFEKIIEDQIEIGTLANKKILNRLKELHIWDDKDLISLMKHGLEVIRPKAKNEFNLNQEVNKGVIYKIEVEHPDTVERNKNKAVTETT